jgi:hypothetical protein
MRFFGRRYRATSVSGRESFGKESPPWSKNIIAEVFAAFRCNHFRKGGLVVAMFPSSKVRRRRGRRRYNAVVL